MIVGYHDPYIEGIPCFSVRGAPPHTSSAPGKANSEST